MKTFTWFNTPCAIATERYGATHGLALVIVAAAANGDIMEGEQLTVATVNPPAPLQPGEIAIKNWSENDGVLEALTTAGIVAAPHRHISSGWVQIPVCRLNEAVLAEYRIGVPA